MPPLAREVVEFILRCFEKSKRTKWVCAQVLLKFPGEGITVRMVKAVADVHGIETERSDKGGTHAKGAGRPKGSRNAGPLSGRPSKAKDVWDLHDAGLSPAEIARKLDITRQAVAKHLAKPRPVKPQ